MTKSYREQRPLLCDEFSEEEVHPTGQKFERRARYSSASGRAKAQVKGAAAVLNRWPEHLSTITTYWWIGLGMIAVLIFVIYNSIAAIALLPPTHLRPAKSQSLDNHLLNLSEENTGLPNIFMHLFVTNNDVLNINDHLPYIEPFSKKYSAFQKNFIFVINDATDDIISISDEMKNEIALNSLWSKPNDVGKGIFQKNITFKVISLTKYMDESPIKKYWRRLPRQFIEFLTRCIAIWDKGGIAFNPAILTPDSPSPVYLDKIHTFLNQYIKVNETISITRKKNGRKKKKRLNNIREIIEHLENDEISSNQIPYNLSAAENRKNISIADTQRERRDKREKRYTKLEILNDHYNSKYISEKENNFDTSKNSTKSDLLFISKEHNNLSDNNDAINKQKLLPMFLKFLYRDPLKTLKTNDSSRNIQQYLSTKPSTESSVKSKRNRNRTRSPKSLVSGSNKPDHASPKIIDNLRLTIDLKGNLVATDTSCHAFIGSVFSNAINHSEEETITDFVIKELSIFCKGILSSCNGVDVVLL